MELRLPSSDCIPKALRSIRTLVPRMRGGRKTPWGYSNAAPTALVARTGLASSSFKSRIVHLPILLVSGSLRSESTLLLSLAMPIQARMKGALAGGNAVTVLLYKARQSSTRGSSNNPRLRSAAHQDTRTRWGVRRLEFTQL